MSFVESKIGRIEFRLPNIAEGPELLALCGFNSKNASDSEWLHNNDLLIMAKIIKNIGHLVTKAVINGKEYPSYNDLLNVREARDLVLEMSNVILASIGGNEEKND